MGPLASAAHGQDSPGVESERSHRIYLLAGTRGLSGDIHAFGGLDAAVDAGRFLLAAQAMLGGGNGYSSKMAWAGPGMRFGPYRTVGLRIVAGVGLYQEHSSATGQSRATFIPAIGGLLEAPVGPVRLALAAVAFTAGYDGGDVTNAIPARGIRLMVGLGR